MMESKVHEIAQKKNINTPQDLSHEARISWTTANKMWTGDISNQRAETLHKVAKVLGVKLDDLYVYRPTN